MLFHSVKRFTRFVAPCSAVAVAAAVAFGGISPAAAQGYGAPQGQQPSQTTPQLSEKNLKLFAQASLEVSNINKKWQERLSGTQDPKKMTEMQRKAGQEMAQAVREEGLSVKKYNTIFKALQASPEIREKIEQMREDIR